MTIFFSFDLFKKQLELQQLCRNFIWPFASRTLKRALLIFPFPVNLCPVSLVCSIRCLDDFKYSSSRSRRPFDFPRGLNCGYIFFGKRSKQDSEQKPHCFVVGRGGACTRPRRAATSVCKQGFCLVWKHPCPRQADLCVS